LSREKKELTSSLHQREDELNNSRASLLDAEKELLDMSHQMESLTTEMLSLRDTAADAEANRKFAEISGEMRERAVKLDEELRLATIHFQKELTRQERYFIFIFFLVYYYFYFIYFFYFFISLFLFFLSFTFIFNLLSFVY
jgi:hypothetical protein